MQDLINMLRDHKIQPTAQRLEVARCALASEDHPTADEVLAMALSRCPTISRATVYNTLNLLAEKGLLVRRTLREGVTVFDPRLEAHHHLIDTETGEIHDIPWDSVVVGDIAEHPEFEVLDYEIVLRGRRK